MADGAAPPKTTSVRLDPDVRERVTQCATDERRSVNNTINLLLTEALDARKVSPR